MFRTGLYGTAAAAAIIWAAPIAGAQNDTAIPRANALIDRMPTLIGDMATLRAEIAAAEAGLPASYACPPGAPSRAPDLSTAQGFSQRSNGLRREVSAFRREYDAVKAIRATTGEVGARALVAGGVTDPIVRSMEQAAQRLTPQITGFANIVDTRPRTEAECQGTNDPITSITLNAPSAEPGRRVNIGISAKTVSGKAVSISAVSFTGVNQFATVQNVRTPGGAAGATFKIDDVRRQGPFRARVSVTGAPAGAPAGAPGTTYVQSFNYTVANAAPTIVSMPVSPSGKPGEDVSLDGQIVIIDKNADAQNIRELVPGSIQLDGHPAGLLTTPDNAYAQNLRVSGRLHDPATGQYTYTLKRSATAKYPHPHGKFGTSVTVTDGGGKSATQSFDVTVENVPPDASFTAPRAPDNAFHSGDGRSVAVAGRVKDANGRADLKTLEIDATAAGGGKYAMFSGLKTLDVKPAGDDGVTFKIDPETFLHTDNSGAHTILGVAADDGAPEQGVAAIATNFTIGITVGNEPPAVGAIGFMTGTELITLKRVCPGDPITVGAVVKDPEGDVLKVTATILPGGTPQELQKAAGSSTYSGVMTAPAAPGDYTIRYDAVEKDTNAPKQHNRVMELTVLVCGDGEEPPKIALGTDPIVEDGPIETALGGEVPAETAGTNPVSIIAGYGEFDAEGMGSISAGTLVPEAGGDEQSLVSIDLDKWEGWYVGGSIKGPTLWGEKTRFTLEYGEYKSDTDSLANDPENGDFGVALTFAEEFTFPTGSSTGLFLGGPFALDGTAQGEGDLFYLKAGLDHPKWENGDLNVRGGGNVFHRKIQTEFRSNAAAFFAGAPFGSITQANQVETETEQFGVGLTLNGRYSLSEPDNWQPGISLNLGGMLEFMNSETTGQFLQQTTCAPTVCGAELANVDFLNDLDESSFEVGGTVRAGASLDFNKYLSLGAGYRYGRIPGIATYDLPNSPDNQPGNWSIGEGEYDGYDLSLQLRSTF